MARLTSAQISEIVALFSSDVELILREHCATLSRSLAYEEERHSNGKFGTFVGNFGKIGDFHAPLYDEIGAPNPDWENAMRIEHTSNQELFTSTNYKYTTCPEYEWSYIVDGVAIPTEHMTNGRVRKDINALTKSAYSVEALLTRPEVIALVLYTGPMFQVYNTILRKHPLEHYQHLKKNDSLFATTIYVLISAIQKVAMVMKLEPGTLLYRGVNGDMEFPSFFTDPDEHGCVGMMEYGFMSTTADINVAVNYSGLLAGKRFPKIFEIRVGSVDRGADISAYSQYPGEKEFLWLPHSFLEPSGDKDVMVTEKGVVEIIKIRVNSNLKAVKIEEYEARKKQLHLNSFKVLLQDLRGQLDEVIDIDLIGSNEAITLKDKIISQSEEIFKFHSASSVSDFNNDQIFRGLVTEMLEMREHALVKVQCYQENPVNGKDYSLSEPLKLAFRDHMGYLSGLLAGGRKDPDLALTLCKKYGIVKSSVSEVNRLGETPILSGCADGIAENLLELLIYAGSNVNTDVKYEGVAGSTSPILVASEYGRTALVRILAKHGANVNTVSGYNRTPIFNAAQGGHTSTVELLGELGADVNLADQDQWTPMHVAAQEGRDEVIQILAHLGAKMNLVDGDGWTPIYIAAYYGKRSTTVKTLGQLGADIHKPANTGWTPLHVACSMGHLEIIKDLIKLGADKNCRPLDGDGEEGISPLGVALENNQTETTEYLRSIGAVV